VHGQVGIREDQPVKSVVTLSERKQCRGVGLVSSGTLSYYDMPYS
jgi:hypothetical protein